MNELHSLIQAANTADDNFSAVVKAHGYKSRWDVTMIPQQSQALRDAYFAKIDADAAVHAAFERSRQS